MILVTFASRVKKKSKFLCGEVMDKDSVLIINKTHKNVDIDQSIKTALYFTKSFICRSSR